MPRAPRRARASSSTPPGTLPWKDGRIEVSLTGDGEVRRLEPGRQADQAGDEVEAGLDAGSQGDEPARQAAGGTAPGHAGTSTPVSAGSGGHLDEPPLSAATCAGDAPFCGPNTVAASVKRS